MFIEVRGKDHEGRDTYVRCTETGYELGLYRKHFSKMTAVIKPKGKVLG